MSSHTIEKVREIIAEALYLDIEEVKSDSVLMSDLGAESIDFLDIVFRLEKQFGVKIPRGEVERRAKGPLSDEQFAVNGVISNVGLAQLKKAMPEVDQSAIKAGLSMRDLPSLFTVATFDRMVSEQLSPAAATPSNVKPLFDVATRRTTANLSSSPKVLTGSVSRI